MKTEEIYNAWKEQKKQMDVDKGFSDKVISRIHQYEQKKKKPLLDMQRFIEVISAHPLAKAGIIAIGAITGLVRVAFMIHVLLFGN